jgi:hypothetical protein
MNLDLKTLPEKLLPTWLFIRRYAVLIFFIVFASLVGFLVFRIDSLSKSEPSETDVSEKLQTIQRPKIDQSSIDKIQELQDQNVDVKSLFQQARDNPFSE